MAVGYLRGAGVALSIRCDPTVGNAEGSAFGLEFEEMGEEGALGQGVELLGDVVVGAADESWEVGGGLGGEDG